MHYTSLTSDPFLVKLIDSVIQNTGGIIFGGFVRDLILGITYSDIDIFYDMSHPIIDRGGFNSLSISRFHQSFCLGDFKIEHFQWMDEPLDDYGHANDTTEIIIHWLDEMNCNRMSTIHLVSGETLITKTDYLDFDINSLYIDATGEIKSTLGVDRLESVISNIRTRTCRPMRDNIEDWRTEYMIKKKGYSCPLLAFQ